MGPAPTLALPHASWLEVHHRANGTSRHLLGAGRASELDHTFHCLAETFPGIELGAPTACPLGSLRPDNALPLRAVPNGRNHYWPMSLLKGADRAGLLLRSLFAKELLGHEILLQILFRRARPQRSVGGRPDGIALRMHSAPPSPAGIYRARREGGSRTAPAVSSSDPGGRGPGSRSPVGLRFAE